MAFYDNCTKDTYKRIILFFCLNGFYLTFGTVLFMLIESAVRQRIGLNSLGSDFAQSMVDSLKEQNFTGKQIVHAFLAYYNGVVLPSTQEEKQGDDFTLRYSRSFYFTLTLTTTLGYGRYAPNTMSGVIFTISYILLGIPLRFVVGCFITGQYRYWLSHLTHRAKKKWPRCRSAGAITGFVFLFLLTILFLFIPPIFFHYTNGWTYAKGLYHSFLSLSTVRIRFAEAKADATYYKSYTMVLMMWVLFGLSYLNLIYNYICIWIKDLAFFVFRCVPENLSGHKFPIYNPVLKNMHLELAKDATHSCDRVRSTAEQSRLYRDVMDSKRKFKVTEKHLIFIKDMISKLEDDYNRRLKTLERMKANREKRNS